MRKLFNIQTALLTSLMALANGSVFAHAEHDPTPKFGGVLVETKVGDIEIVAKPDSIRIHITDHGKDVKLEGAKAKVTLLNGAEKTEADLIPTGNKLEAKGTFKVTKGTKGIALLTLAGQPATTARFEIK